MNMSNFWDGMWYDVLALGMGCGYEYGKGIMGLYKGLDVCDIRKDLGLRAMVLWAFFSFWDGMRMIPIGTCTRILATVSDSIATLGSSQLEDLAQVARSTTAKDFYNGSCRISFSFH